MCPLCYLLPVDDTDVGVSGPAVGGCRGLLDGTLYSCIIRRGLAVLCIMRIICISLPDRPNLLLEGYDDSPPRRAPAAPETASGGWVVSVTA